MIEILFNPERYVGVLIQPRHGSKGPSMAMVLFNL